MIKTATIAITIAVLLGPALCVHAQTQPAAPTTEKITVVSVTGPAQKMVVTDDAETWQPLKAGQALSKMTLIRTGFRSKVVLSLAGRGQIVVQGPAKMGISEFLKRPDSTRTRIGLKYGTLRTSIDRKVGPHDLEVATPVATLSVTGSHSELSCLTDNNTGLKVRVLGGYWSVQGNPTKQTAGPGEGTDNHGTHNQQILQDGRGPQMNQPGQNNNENQNLMRNKGGRGIFGASGASSGVDLLFGSSSSSYQDQRNGETQMN